MNNNFKDVRISIAGQILKQDGSVSGAKIEFGINEERIGQIAYNTLITELIQSGGTGFQNWMDLSDDYKKAWVKVGKLSVTVKEI